MIEWLELLTGVGAYFGIGLATARAMAKRIYRTTMKRYSKNLTQQKDSYLWMLVTWVLFWPAKAGFYLLKVALWALVILPIDTAVKRAAALVNAPVATVLHDADAAYKEAASWTERAGAKDATDIDKEFATQMRNDAYERYERACEDLGLQKIQRLAITTGATRETVDRGMETARRTLLKEGMARGAYLHDPTDPDDSWPNLGSQY